jgi:hypothetical protein
MPTSSQGKLQGDIPAGVLLSSISTGSTLGLNLAGTATVVSGQTTIAVLFPYGSEPDANFHIMCIPYTKGTTACYVEGISSVSAAGFTITVSANPGVGGCVIAWFLVRDA